MLIIGIDCKENTCHQCQFVNYSRRDCRLFDCQLKVLDNGSYERNDMCTELEMLYGAYSNTLERALRGLLKVIEEGLDER